MDGIHTAPHAEAWNKGKLVGQKAPFKLQEIWAIRIRLQMQGRLRDLALFDTQKVLTHSHIPVLVCR